MKKFCIVLVGVPAAGKTTFVNELKEHFTFKIASSDDYIQAQADREGKTYNEVFFECIKYADAAYQNQIHRAFDNGENLVCDRTFTSIKSRRQIIGLIPTGYEKIAVFFPTPDHKEHRRRLNSRPGKTIPQHVIKSMIGSLVPPSVAEGFDLVINADAFLRALKS